MAGRDWRRIPILPKKNWDLKQSCLRESTSELNNPARGWYQICTLRPEKDVDSQVAEWCFLPGEKLTFLRIDIGAFRNRELDKKALTSIRTALNVLRATGRELIVRGVYDTQGLGIEHEPARFERVTVHTEQLMKVLGEYQDCIFVYQGVLLGSWGEMHSSRYLTQPRVHLLVDMMERLLGPETFLAVRRPVFYRMVRSEAQYGQGMEKRLGLFDDAILGSDTDLGTFGWQSAAEGGWNSPWLPEEELPFAQKLCRTVPQGGEALYPESGPMSLEKTVDGLHRRRITYLNDQHDKAVLALWQEQKWEREDAWFGVNGLDYIGAHLGYRFVVCKASVRTDEKKGFVSIAAEISNVGFAPCYQELELQLIQICTDGKQHIYFPDADMRRLDSGKTMRVTCAAAAEESELYLRMFRCRDRREVYFGNAPQTCNGVCLGMLVHV